MTTALLLIIALSELQSATAAPDSNRALEARAIGRARRLLETHRELLEIPGLSVTVMRQGRVVWSEGIGFADLEQRVPVTPLTRFPIASLSKPITMTGAALLVQEGRLDLDSPVQRYVPAFPRKRWPVTVRQLASNQSGIRHYRGDADAYPTVGAASLTAALHRFQDDSLVFEPGTRAAYSSPAFVLLGAVIEGASGQAYLDFMRERVFRPLGMHATGPARHDSIIPWRSASYSENAAGDRVPAPFLDLSSRWPSGGLLSTAEDLARLGTGLLTGTLLRRETVETLWTTTRLRDGTGTADGLGWELGTDHSGRRVVRFDGNLPGARSLIGIQPETGVVVALLMNTGKSVFFNQQELLELLELFTDPAPAPPPRNQSDLSGAWQYRMTFDGEAIRGTVHLYHQGGEYHGMITVPNRFFGQRLYPMPVVTLPGTRAVLIGVMGGTWFRFRLGVRDNLLTDGTWEFGSMRGEVTAVRRVPSA